MSTTPAGPKEKLKRLFGGNLAARITAGELIPDEEYALPRTYQVVGYTGVARLLGIGPASVRHYWAADLERGFSQSLPAPDVVLHRFVDRSDGAEEIELLPGWHPQTILDWIPYRVGGGNHTTKTSPGGRRGFDGGSKPRRQSAAADQPAELVAPS
jgi:hypothetical protein